MELMGHINIGIQHTRFNVKKVHLVGWIQLPDTPNHAAVKKTLHIIYVSICFLFCP